MIRRMMYMKKDNSNDIQVRTVVEVIHDYPIECSNDSLVISKLITANDSAIHLIVEEDGTENTIRLPYRHDSSGNLDLSQSVGYTCDNPYEVQNLLIDIYESICKREGLTSVLDKPKDSTPSKDSAPEETTSDDHNKLGVLEVLADMNHEFEYPTSNIVATRYRTRNGGTLIVLDSGSDDEGNSVLNTIVIHPLKTRRGNDYAVSHDFSSVQDGVSDEDLCYAVIQTLYSHVCEINDLEDGD